ncbi:beta galactosidase jelly roll domain-containing protein [Myxococcota bacterium]|nr:beta galactosidase jelly roll domain-containing protein [Myxococcota bacterium]
MTPKKSPRPHHCWPSSQTLFKAVASDAERTPSIPRTLDVVKLQKVFRNGGFPAFDRANAPVSLGPLAIDHRSLRSGLPHFLRGALGNGLVFRSASSSGRRGIRLAKADLLQVPGDWNSQDPKLFFYEGSVWYRRDFEHQLKNGHRVFIYFGAANYETVAWLNGQEIGRHIGGFTPFAFEVTEIIRSGTNSLFVKIDNTRNRSGVPMTSTDWWNYDGPTREIELVEVPETFIHRFGIALQGDKLVGFVQLEGPFAGGISNSRTDYR